jgi:hypothetical protein
MMRLPSDVFMVSETQTTITRQCPFCEGPVEDSLGKDINFIVHLGSPTPRHQLKQAWADYLSFMHRV